MNQPLRVFFRNWTWNCNIVSISYIESCNCYAAYCTTEISKELWVYSYTKDMKSIFRAEIVGEKDSLAGALNENKVGGGPYELWGGELRPRYNWQKTPAKYRY